MSVTKQTVNQAKPSGTTKSLERELYDENMNFFKNAMEAPGAREVNCNRWLQGVFRGLIAIGEIGAKEQDIAFNQAFDEIDDDKVLAELWSGAIKVQQDLKDMMAENLGVAKKVMDQSSAPADLDLKTFSLAVFPVFETVHSFVDFEGQAGEEAKIAKDAVLKVFFSECDVEDFMKLIWRGVGMMNHPAARAITKDTCKTCYGNWVDKDVVKQYLQYDMDEPNIGMCVAAHERVEKSFAGGQAHVFNNGDGTATLQSWSGKCGCYFSKIYDIIEPHANHCNCSEQTLEGFYTNMLGGRKVRVTCTESYARGSKDMCSFLIQLPDGMDNKEIDDVMVLPS